jgi:hypothetical protein
MQHGTNRHGSFRQRLVARIRKWFSRVRLRMARFLENGTNSATLMVVPHSERRIIKIEMSFFLLGFIVLGLVALIAAGFAFLPEGSTAPAALVRLEGFVAHYDRQLGLFRRHAAGAIAGLQDMLGELDRFEEILDLGGSPIAESEDDSGLPEVGRLERISRRLAAGSHRMARAERMVGTLRRVMDRIPSLWPVGGGGVVTSRFGNRFHPFTGMPDFHTGIDIAWMKGARIRASAAGWVTKADEDANYGNAVVIRHEYGFSTRYAHLDEIEVEEGMRVSKGELIGRMGDSGRATGVHLHYEVLLENQAIDPLPYLTSKF